MFSLSFSDNPVQMFSGRDSTYCLAKMSMSPHDVGKDTSGSLTEKEIEDLNGWIKYFDEKYYIQGRTVYNKE